MIRVTQPALNKIASLSDLSNSIRSENIPSLSDLSNSPRSEKNTNTLRFPYIHAYQYKYRIPREYIANNKLIKVVLEKKKKRKKRIHWRNEKQKRHPMILPGGPITASAGQDGSDGGRKSPLFRHCRATGLII